MRAIMIETNDRTVKALKCFIGQLTDQELLEIIADAPRVAGIEGRAEHYVQLITRFWEQLDKIAL